MNKESATPTITHDYDPSGEGYETIDYTFASAQMFVIGRFTRSQPNKVMLFGCFDIETSEPVPDCDQELVLLAREYLARHFSEIDDQLYSRMP